MGFYEDDRIRSKNAECNKVSEKDIEELHEEAWNLVGQGRWKEYQELINKIRKEVYGLPPLKLPRYINDK